MNTIYASSDNSAILMSKHKPYRKCTVSFFSGRAAKHMINKSLEGKWSTEVIPFFEYTYLCNEYIIIAFNIDRFQLIAVKEDVFYG